MWQAKLCVSRYVWGSWAEEAALLNRMKSAFSQDCLLKSKTLGHEYTPQIIRSRKSIKSLFTE